MAPEGKTMLSFSGEARNMPMASSFCLLAWVLPLSVNPMVSAAWLSTLLNI
jgi:hypothetical protein